MKSLVANVAGAGKDNIVHDPIATALPTSHPTGPTQ